MKSLFHLLFAAACLAVAIPVVQAHNDDDAAVKATLRAARSGADSLARHLANGGDVNATDEDGETALMEAADDGLLAAVEALLAAGADVNAQDEDGKTALMFAADEGHAKVVAALLAAGADATLRDHKGRTALDHARKEGRTSVADILSAPPVRP